MVIENNDVMGCLRFGCWVLWVCGFSIYWWFFGFDWQWLVKFECFDMGYFLGVCSYGFMFDKDVCLVVVVWWLILGHEFGGYGLKREREREREREL